MAKSGKTNFSKLFVWIILLMLIVGLAGFGARNFGGHVESIGKVGNTDISVTRYANALTRQLRQFEQQTGQRMTLVQARQFGLDQIVLAQVIGLTALENEAAALGISVGDTAVRDQLVRVPSFQGLDGQFDRTAYEFALDGIGLKSAEYEDTVRVEAARALLQAAVLGGVDTPGILTDTLFAFAREERDLTWAAIGADALPTPIAAPTDAELRAFHGDNEDQFMLPEGRRITYVWTTPEMRLDGVTVTDEALRKLYDERIERFVVPERRLVERLVFGDDAAAQAAMDAIAAGEKTFDALVADRGLELADVDLGDVTRQQLDAAGDAVFALIAPGVVGPAPSNLGPALYRMNAILAAQETTFDEAKDGLRAEAARDAARRQIADEGEALQDLLASGATLEELAADSDLELGTILWSADVASGIAGYEAFRATAAAVTAEDFPEVFDLADGGLAAIRLDEIVPARVEEFDAARDKVAAAWILAETRAAALAHAESLRADFAAGVEPSVAGLTLIAESGIRRDSFLDGAPATLVARAFALDPDTWDVIETASGAAILRLDAVHAAVLDDEARAAKDGFAANAAQTYAQDLLDLFTVAVQNRAGLSLEQAAINAVHAQIP